MKISLDDLAPLGAPALHTIETGGLVRVQEGKIVVSILRDENLSTDEAMCRATMLVPASCAGGRKTFVTALAIHKDNKFYTFINMYKPGSKFSSEVAVSFEYGMMHRTIGPSGRFTTPAVVSSKAGKGISTVEIKNEVTDVDSLTGTIRIRPRRGVGSLAVDAEILELLVEAAYHSVQTVVGDDEIGVPMIQSEFGSDRVLDINDGVFGLNFLFLGGPPPTCFSSFDTDDDGELTINDGIGIFNFLFLGGGAPGTPYPACGLDPTADALTCDTFPPCL